MRALGERIRCLAQALGDAHKSVQSMKDEAKTASVTASGELLEVLMILYQ